MEGRAGLQQLQGMDASFIALETRNSPMHIGSILIYNPATAPGGFVRFKDILRFFESRMVLSRTMRQRLVRVPFDLDYPYWIEDASFDLEYHLRHLALPRPGDWRQLCIQAARVFARPLDLTRPPWEFTVIEGLDNIPGVPAGSYAFVTKVHHAAIDGLSGIDLMEALHTLTPDAPPPDKIDRWQGEAAPTAALDAAAAALPPDAAAFPRAAGGAAGSAGAQVSSGRMRPPGRGERFATAARYARPSFGRYRTSTRPPSARSWPASLPRARTG